MSDYDWCPKCDAHGSHVVTDFDEDCGNFYRCEACGECWSVQGQNDPKLSAIAQSLQLTGDGTTVALSFTVPAEILDMIPKQMIQ